MSGKPLKKGRWKQRILAALFLAGMVLFLGWLLSETLLAKAGSLLVFEKADFKRVDAVVVLPGSMPDRVLEAFALMRDSRADMAFLLGGDTIDPSGELDRLQIHIPTNQDINEQVLLRKGIPAGRILRVPGTSASSREDARLIRSFIEFQPVKSIAVVTCKYHSYRAYLSFRQELAGSDVEIFSKPSRYCPFEPERWWRDGQTKIFLFEMMKLAAYWTGVS